MNAIRTTITVAEFKKLTWTSLDALTDDINDIWVKLMPNNKVRISVLGMEVIKEMSVEDYRECLK